MPTLAHARLTAPGATPSQWMVYLHGILGSGPNWRTFAKQIVATRPDWGAVLVDLRLHGESRGFPPPHTLSAAAFDVVELLRIPELSKASISVLGHSFGGKVGIELAAQLAEIDNRAVEHLFVIDSTPGARPDGRGSSGVKHIVDLLRDLPTEFADREAFIAWIETRGVNRMTAMWLAMNVRPDDSGRFVFRIPIEDVRAMMDDYFRRDLWEVLEKPPKPMKTHLIAGGKSEVFDKADLARGRTLPNTTVNVIPNAGHWVHVDAPDALRGLVLDLLER